MPQSRHSTARFQGTKGNSILYDAFVTVGIVAAKCRFHHSGANQPERTKSTLDTGRHVGRMQPNADRQLPIQTSSFCHEVGRTDIKLWFADLRARPALLPIEKPTHASQQVRPVAWQRRQGYPTCHSDSGKVKHLRACCILSQCMTCFGSLTVHGCEMIICRQEYCTAIEQTGTPQA